MYINPLWQKKLVVSWEIGRGSREGQDWGTTNGYKSTFEIIAMCFIVTVMVS